MLLPGRPRSRRPLGTGSRRRLRARCAAAENPRARAVPGDAKPAVTGVSLSVTPSWGAAGPGEALLSRRPPEPGLQPPTLGPWQRGRANNQRKSRSNAVLCHWLGSPVRFSTSGRGGSGEEKWPRCYLQCDSLQKGPQLVSILRVILWVNCATGSSTAGLQTGFNDFGAGRVLLKNATCCNTTNNSCKKHSACQK